MPWPRLGRAADAPAADISIEAARRPKARADGLSLFLPMTLLLAFILDLLIGDPAAWPHPIRWMGRAIVYWEPFFRRREQRLRRGGAMFTAALVAATWGLAYLLVKSAQGISPWLGGFLNMVMIYYALAARALQDAARVVADDLGRSDLPAARRSVGLIVGRETDRLDREGVARAVVETVAENLVDGVIAPLFYAVIGGGPLALAYKMVNTLDSMIGYRNDRYRDFGWAAARLDDAANWLPARLTLPFVALAAACLNGRGKEALALARRDGQKHTSPNAGLPEAAFAGALAVRLGGPNRYHGVMVAKPWIGAEFGPVTTAHIQKACDLMLLAVVWAVVLLWGLPGAVAALLF